MVMWSWLGLRRGKATTGWPRPGGDDGQAGVLGMPRLDPERCRAGCADCSEVCPSERPEPRAGGYRAAAADRLRPLPGLSALHRGLSRGGADALRRLVLRGNPARGPSLGEAIGSPAGQTLGGRLAALRRSLHIRHLDAGSCNGCESELQALNNPFYNLHRLGIFFTASPRFADLLLVTGPVTAPMREPLRSTYEAMPDPRLVMACGTCAVSGGVAAGGYNSGCGVDQWLPVDLYLPGCPPNPAAVIEGLLVLLERMPQRVKGGRLER